MSKKRDLWRFILLLFVLAIILWGSGYFERFFSFVQINVHNFFINFLKFQEEIKSYISLTKNLHEELEAWQKRVLELYNENLRLKLVLENIKRREAAISWLEDLTKKNISIVYADIVGRDPVKWNLEFKINKGARDKIKVGMPVLYKDQVVGKIVKVDLSYSIVRTLYDPNFIMGVTILSTKDQGIIRGAYDHMELAYLFSDHGIKEGDLLVTSGTDENIPYGLKLGYISELKEKAIFAFTKIKIFPLINISNIEGVAICTGF